MTSRLPPEVCHVVSFDIIAKLYYWCKKSEPEIGKIVEKKVVMCISLHGDDSIYPTSFNVHICHIWNNLYIFDNYIYVFQFNHVCANIWYEFWIIILETYTNTQHFISPINNLCELNVHMLHTEEIIWSVRMICGWVWRLMEGLCLISVCQIP